MSVKRNWRKYVYDSKGRRKKRFKNHYDNYKPSFTRRRRRRTALVVLGLMLVPLLVLAVL